MRQAIVRGLFGVIVAMTSTATAVHAACPALPLAGCRRPLAADKALLLLKNKGGAGDKLVWKWLKGEATAATDFGNPVDVATYSLCIYDETAGTPALKLTAIVPPSGNWVGTKKGFKYNDAAVATAGIKSILLNSGEAGKAKIIVKGKDDGLDTPTLPLAEDQHVIVQLRNGSVCWEARFSQPNKKNDAGQFKDKGDGPISAPTSTPTGAGPIATTTKTPTVTSTAATTPTRTRTNTAGVAAATSTPTKTSTPQAATATPTTMSGGPVCGNGFLEAGETCAGCPADCTVSTCTAVAPLQVFRVNYAQPPGAIVTFVQALVGYKSNRVSLPGSGSAPGARVKLRPTGTSQLVNDLNYAIQVTLQANSGVFFADGRLFTVDFDSCSGQSPVTPADFGCQMTQCSSSFGDVLGCTCTVTTAP